MIDRRALMCGTASAALAAVAPISVTAAARGAVTPDPVTARVAVAIAQAMPSTLRAQVLEDAALRGWDAADGPPPLREVKAAVAAEHRAGQSRIVRGLRLSHTELAWYAAHAQRIGLGVRGAA